MYIPKNRVKTNLFTGGGEYQKFIDGTEYKGFYWATFDGRFFTGKNPDDLPSEELVTIDQSKLLWELTPPEGAIFIENYAENYDFLTYQNQTQNMDMVNDYNRVKKIDVSKVRKIPTTYYPQPTLDDYKLGAFTRYFCTKVNETVFIELNKETFLKIRNKSRDYDWAMYRLFKLPWTLNGTLEEVETINRNMVLIAERRIKKRGLQEFLNFNYGKFYDASKNPPSEEFKTYQVSLNSKTSGEIP
jgi:hypothetical protein